MSKEPSRPLRRLTPAHFSLYRAYLEGLVEATLHAHYSAPGTGRARRPPHARDVARHANDRRGPRGTSTPRILCG